MFPVPDVTQVQDVAEQLGSKAMTVEQIEALAEEQLRAPNTKISGRWSGTYLGGDPSAKEHRTSFEFRTVGEMLGWYNGYQLPGIERLLIKRE